MSLPALTASCWVSAHAGTGKTRILIDRLLQLLLSGVAPERLVCLTFTRAAAAEMAERLQKTLQTWALMEEDALKEQLKIFQGRSPTSAQRRTARQLFAQVLETPGGLRIQTIHAFCQHLLNCFPLEAGVPPDFDILDEHTAAALRREARNAILEHAAFEDTITKLAHLVSDQDFDRLIKEITSTQQTGQEIQEVSEETLTSALGLGEETEESLIHSLVKSTPPRVLNALKAGSPKDKDRATLLEGMSEKTPQAWEDYLLVFLTKDGGARTTLATKAALSTWPGCEPYLRTEQTRLLKIIERLNTLRIKEASLAVSTLKKAVRQEYKALKEAQGVLDYDDLITKTAALLHNREDTLWVLYKLDARIDHILVDEAQDTSPRQWAIIRALGDEFFTGESARTEPRSLFVVGDEKQSIFGFQGASSEISRAMRTHFEKRVKGAKRPWHPMQLDRSHRSNPTILQAVDAVCAHLGLSQTRHQASRPTARGRVVLWELEQAQTQVEAGRALARRIATTIKTWLKNNTPHPSQDRAIEPGDILILVRSRDPFMGLLLQALEKDKIPTTGLDRLPVREHLAVRDLLSLGRFALLPQDDFNLACLLRSPLCGLSPDALQALAAPRTGTLWDALEAGEIKTFLKETLARADYQLPFEFFAQTLVSHRQHFASRLGTQAQEILDEFLNLVLVHEKTHIPHLEGLLHWMESLEADIKRDTEHHAQGVRLMTIHVAKGLESDIVFLPDTCHSGAHSRHIPFMLPTDKGVGVWCHGAASRPPLCEELTHRWKEQENQEHQRLLYVAMTRAREWLYIGGAKGQRALPQECWYTTVRDALEAHHLLGAPPQEAAGVARTPQRAQKPPPLPSWVRSAAPQERTSQISPSQLGEEATSTETDIPRQYGTLVHHLLEQLPKGHAPSQEAWGIEAPELFAEALTEAQGVYHTFPWLFAPATSRGEVPIAGVLNRPQSPLVITGYIDRLVITPEEVLVVDYKTTRRPIKSGQIPLPWRRQLAAYAALVRSLWPKRHVRAALLLTHTRQFLEIPQKQLQALSPLVP